MKKRQKKYHHGDLKRALIDAGLIELEEKGVENLSMRAIAARVGVSHTAPKKHFDGIRGLLTAIATRGFEMQVGKMKEDESGSASSGDGYLRFALEHPELFKLMFSCALTNAADPDLQRASVESYAILRKSVSRLSGSEDRHDDGTREAEWALWSLVHGYAMLLIDGELPKTKDGGATLSVSNMLQALAPVLRGAKVEGDGTSSSDAVNRADSPPSLGS